MNRSLRVRLTITIVAVTAPLIAALAFFLFGAVSEAVWDSFDQRLLDDARVMAGLVEQEGDDFDVEIMPVVKRFESDPDTKTLFGIWDPDGETLVRGAPTSEALERSSRLESEPWAWDGTFDDGTAARFVGFSFMPTVDPEDGIPTEVRPLTIALGRETHRTDDLLAELARLFWMLGTGMVLVSSAVAGWAVSRGLRPMTRVSTEIARIDEEHLDRPVPTEGVPVELRPVIDRLNELLERLQTAFIRERQFSADVAHELRTPLAVLRASSELALKDPELTDGARRRVDGMLETIDETSRLVEDLMLLARAESGTSSVETEAVDIGELVEAAWAKLADAAGKRQLTLRKSIPAATYVETDLLKVSHVVSNLLSNAVAYTEEGGWIEVESAPDEGLVLRVSDSGPMIPDDQLPHLFDRFWRADEARSAVGEHAGIGLSLVKSMCGVLGFEITAENDEGIVRFSVRNAPDA